ncbi:MAG: hypothetical protein GX751_05200 [Desulfuromonadaceae bacterium]|jgi:hypothetical protein|nr:hypothetical protein [Desulfuromonadaceae bacterium]
MYFIPLNQLESVELVINALRMAGGEADCSTCPASKACGKQCLAIADSVDRMLVAGILPTLDSNAPSSDKEGPGKGSGGGGGKGAKGNLTVIK